MNLSTQNDAVPCQHGILAPISQRFVPVGGRLHTRYAPVRHSCALRVATSGLTVRLACIKPAASVHPEPGSNSPSYLISFFLFVCPGLFLLFILSYESLEALKNNLSYLLHHSIRSKNMSPSLSPRLRRGASSLAAPSSGAQKTGLQKYTFCPYRQHWKQKIFENFFSGCVSTCSNDIFLGNRLKITPGGHFYGAFCGFRRGVFGNFRRKRAQNEVPWIRVQRTENVETR